MTHRIIIVVLLSFLCSDILCQTYGSGTVSRIELLAREIQENNSRIKKNDADYQNTYVDEADEKSRLEQSVGQAIKRRDEEQSSMMQRLKDKEYEIEHETSWVNRRKSAESGWKEYKPGTCSAGGPPPICSADHWYGVSVREAMEEYEALKQKTLDAIKASIRNYDDNITNARNNVVNFLTWNEFMSERTRLEKDNKKRHAENNDKRAEIARLSLQFKQEIINETKGKVKALCSETLYLAAQMNFIALRIDILNVKVRDIQAQEKTALIDLENKIRKQNDLEISAEEKKIIQYRAEILKAQQQFSVESRAPEAKLSALLKEKEVLEDRINHTGSMEVNKLSQLQEQLSVVKASIEKTESFLEKLNTDLNERKRWLNEQIESSMNRKSNLFLDLYKRIDSAVTILKDAYTAKKDILSSTIDLRKQALVTAGRSLSRKKEDLDQLFKKYLTLVEGERRRILESCTEAGAVCGGADTYSASSALWSESLGCIELMEGGHAKTPTYGCADEAELYLSYFNALVQGLSPEDNSALQRKTSNTKYDAIMEKVHD